MLSRRRFLRGSGGILLSLPLLEAFAVGGAQQAPVRFVNLGFIYGVAYQNHWFPKSTGLDYEITEGLKPLERHKSDFTLFKNMDNPLARDSHYSCTTLFTGADRRRTPGRSFHNSISSDQVAARHLGKDTRYTSIELATSPSELGTGPGLSLAWNEEGKPIPGIADPLEFFNMLFGNGKVTRESLATEKSILDSLMEESRSISSVISKADRNKLDEYLESIRQAEVRLQKSQNWFDVPKPKAGYDSPVEGLIGTQNIRFMYDLIVSAMQVDATRVISFLQPLQSMFNEQEIGTSTHVVSHHTSKTEAVVHAKRKDVLHAEMLAYFIDKLKSTKDIDGRSLFDNCVVHFASGVRYGHILTDVPVIVTGGGGGKLRHKGYLELDDDKARLSNLWLTSLQTANVPVAQFSDSNGVLEELWT